MSTALSSPVHRLRRDPCQAGRVRLDRLPPTPRGAVRVVRRPSGTQGYLWLLILGSGYIGAALCLMFLLSQFLSCRSQGGLRPRWSPA